MCKVIEQFEKNEKLLSTVLDFTLVVSPMFFPRHTHDVG